MEIFFLFQVRAARSRVGAAALCFLEPTSMFGSQVFGILDPNGYRLVFVEEASFRSSL